MALRPKKYTSICFDEQMRDYPDRLEKYYEHKAYNETDTYRRQIFFNHAEHWKKVKPAREEINDL